MTKAEPQGIITSWICIPQYDKLKLILEFPQYPITQLTAIRFSRLLPFFAMNKSNANNGTQAVERALKILQCFTVDQPCLSASKISSQTGLTLPSVYRLAKALQLQGLLVYDPIVRCYNLGAEVLRLAGVIMQRDDVQFLALQRLEVLRELTGETVALHWLLAYQRVCVLEIVSPRPIRMSSGIGNPFPLYAGASGKAMLSWFTQAELEAYFKVTSLLAITPRTITEKETLMRELDQIREQRFATSFGESVTGASALAAPILNSNGRPLAAINITGPEERWTMAKMLESKDAVLAKTDEIMRQLGAARIQRSDSALQNSPPPPGLIEKA